MNRRNQLKWMVLLAAAVVLPTVSLLWFMSRVVANERLVIQQKLAAVYQQQLKEAVDDAGLRMNSRLEALGQTDWSSNPYGLLRRLVLDENFQGVVLWDRDGKPVYPSADHPADLIEIEGEALAEAWQLEFFDQDYAAAAERYSQLIDSTDSRALAGQGRNLMRLDRWDEAVEAALKKQDSRALAGQVRCLVRLDRWDEAVEAALKQQEPSAAPARLLLLTLLRKADGVAGQAGMAARLVAALERDLFRNGSEHLSSVQNSFIARRLMKELDDADVPGYMMPLIEAESRSLQVQARYRKPGGPVDTVREIDGIRLYIHRRPTPYGEMMIVLTNEGLETLLEGFRGVFGDDEVGLRILDAQGRLIAGEANEGAPVIVAAPLPKGFPEGTIELFFADGDLFKRAADRQIAVYVWTGILVILLMLGVGAFAVQAVGRQIRLNRMKNDFIATVSHELKTPLASMRLLVDTLLEGRTRDEAHAEEYLHMIARENERLTRMIENFLSFSRMERNKNAFTMAAASPKAIAEDAVNSVCTKYRANSCRLETELADGLPDVSADHDAIVTVLINLLDNACKYTTENKQIRLSLFQEEDEVCFAVSDNGIGMSRRQLRRIFDSFYQVDDSLARATEGCGLGLSIVQFIVNAHKGHIEVDSLPGKGSTFTVRLPINRRNGTD